MRRIGNGHWKWRLEVEIGNGDSGQWKQHVARLVTRRPVGRVCLVGARLVKTNPAPAKSLKIHEKQKIKMSKMAASAAIFGILIFCFSTRARPFLRGWFQLPGCLFARLPRCNPLPGCSFARLSARLYPLARNIGRMENF